MGARSNVSIQQASCVLKEETLSDPTLVGGSGFEVEHQGSKKAKPAIGWVTFPAPRIASGSKFPRKLSFIVCHDFIMDVFQLTEKKDKVEERGKKAFEAIMKDKKSERVPEPEL